jgi:hypothetical protein
MPDGDPTTTKYIYRVAAIFPEHFQSFTIVLKNHLFYSFFRRKPTQLFAEQYVKIKPAHSGKDELAGTSKRWDCLRTSRRTDREGDYELQRYQ